MPPYHARYGGYLLLLSFFISFSCTTDQLPEPEPGDCDNVTATYTDDIQAIIEETCAYSSCHLGAAPGVYNSYAGILPVLQSGEFRNRVIDMRSDPTVGMPPDDVPNGRRSDLSQAEIDLINCWLEAGFPE